MAAAEHRLRRLELLGAMTRGDRRGGHGAAADLVQFNLDTPLGHSALAVLMDSVGEKAEEERFAEENTRLYSLSVKMKKVEALSPAVMELLGSVGVASVVLFGGYQVIHGGMTPGTFFSFMTALLLLYEPVKRLARVNNRVQEALSAAEVASVVYYPEPLHRSRPYAAEAPSLPEAEAAAAEVLSLPMGPDLDAPTQEYIAERIREALR